MEIVTERIWTLSTSHINEKTAKWLDSDECPLGVIKYDCGWIIRVPCLNYGIPIDLEVIVDFARKHEIDRIKMNADGPIEEYLKTYEWEKKDETDVRYPIIGLLYAQNGDLSFWHDFNLSEEDENKIWKILLKYETDGVSVRGTKEFVIREINSMYED